MRANLNRVPSLLAIGLGLMLVGCGGGGGGGGGTPGTVTIIEPAVYAPQLVAGTTLRFEAKVANGNGSPLSWGVQTGDTCTASNGVSTLGTPGGDATLGTMPLSSANKTEITYTAPNTPPPGAIVTVTALQSPNTTGPCAVIYVVATTNDLFNFRFVFRLRGFSGLPACLLPLSVDSIPTATASSPMALKTSTSLRQTAVPSPSSRSRSPAPTTWIAQATER